MLDSALAMHDTLLMRAPADARHDVDACPFCTDWAMTDEGIPSGSGRLEFADAKAPYGAVKYADPGYQADKVKRYPIDTEAHAKAAWSYIHQESNAGKYTADQLSKIRSAIAAALKQFGVEAEEKQAGVQKPKSGSDAKSGTQKASSQSDAASEGGTKHMDENTETISKETHEALLDQAVRRATADLTAANETLTQQVTNLTSELAAKTEALDKANADNEKVNGDLDTAQVALKAAQDENAQLKADMAAKDAAAALAETASARAAQVRNLGLFDEKTISDRASKWAEKDEAAWNESLTEWQALKGAGGAATIPTDAASAITGTSGGAGSPGGQPVGTARRTALGLPSKA